MVEMRKRGLVAVALGVAAMGCVTVTPVAGPNGEEAQLIKCSSTEDCYDKAQEVCAGSTYQLVESGNRSATGVTGNGVVVSSSWHEMVIHCGAPAGASTTAAAASDAADPKPTEDAPTNAAGFTFGKSLEETKSLCTGSSFDWKEGHASYVCSGTPVNTGLNAHARLSFCDDELCRIDVMMPPQTSGPSLSEILERTVTTLSKRYGPPTEHEVVYGSSCAGAALPACLGDGSAHFFYEWRWAGHQKVTLTLGPRKPHPAGAAVNPSTVSTLRIRYDTGKRATSKKDESVAGAAPASSGDIEGL
jgi:hypothetical protein